jgi:hypothetical protein
MFVSRESYTGETNNGDCESAVVIGVSGFSVGLVRGMEKSPSRFVRVL